MFILWHSLFSAYHGHLASLKQLSTHRLSSGVSQRPDAHVSIVSLKEETREREKDYLEGFLFFFKCMMRRACSYRRCVRLDVATIMGWGNMHSKCNEHTGMPCCFL